jgi:hypothetical protein
MVVLYPLQFHRRADWQWKARVRAVVRSAARDASAANRGNECCPSCRLPAARPFVSSYLPGSVVEHHWLCRSCELKWTSRFNPLLV